MNNYQLTVDIQTWVVNHKWLPALRSAISVRMAEHLNKMGFRSYEAIEEGEG